MKKILFFVFLTGIGITNNFAKANTGWGQPPKLVSVSEDGGAATIAYGQNTIQINVVWPGRTDGGGIIIAPPVKPQSWYLGTDNQWRANAMYNESEGMSAGYGKVYVVVGHKINDKMSFTGAFVSARWDHPISIPSWISKYEPGTYTPPTGWYDQVSVYLDEQYGLYTIL